MSGRSRGAGVIAAVFAELREAETEPVEGAFRDAKFVDTSLGTGLPDRLAAVSGARLAPGGAVASGAAAELFPDGFFSGGQG